MEKYNIIASIAKIENKNNNPNLEVIGSFVKYKKPIDLKKIIKNSTFLLKNTNFFIGNEFFVIYLNYWESYDMRGIIAKANPKIKIIEINIFKFVQAIKEEMSLDLHKVLNTKNELNKSKIYRDDSELFSLKNLLLRDNMKNINVILIFDSITLSNFYILLKTLGITIYGGNSQRRHLLSTVHKSLVMFLQLLDNMAISPNIIYESYTDVEMSKGKYVNKIGRLIDNVRNSKDTEERQKNISIINEYTKMVSKEFDFLKKFNELLEFYITITQYYLIIIKNNKELTRLSEKVESHRPKIKSLSSEIHKTEEDVRFLVQSMYKLDNNYFNEQGEFIYDPDIKIDLNNVKSSLGENTKYSKINTFNQKREYSTFVRNNSCNNIRYNIFYNNNNNIGAGYLIGKQLDKNEIENANKAQELRDKKLEGIADNVNNLKNSISEISKKLDVQTSNNLEQNSMIQKKVQSIEESSKNIKDIVENNGNSNELVENTLKLNDQVKDLNDILNNISNSSIFDFDVQFIYNYFDTLSDLQLLAFIQLCFLVVILLNLITIISILFGNQIIKYYNLEERLPKLAIFFSLRAKLTKYSLIWNFFFTLFICVELIVINLIVFYIQ